MTSKWRKPLDYKQFFGSSFLDANSTNQNSSGVQIPKVKANTSTTDSKTNSISNGIVPNGSLSPKKPLRHPKPNSNDQKENPPPSHTTQAVHKPIPKPALKSSIIQELDDTDPSKVTRAKRKRSEFSIESLDSENDLQDSKMTSSNQNKTSNKRAKKGSIKADKEEQETDTEFALGDVPEDQEDQYNAGTNMEIDNQTKAKSTNPALAAGQSIEDETDELLNEINGTPPESHKNPVHQHEDYNHDRKEKSPSPVPTRKSTRMNAKSAGVSAQAVAAPAVPHKKQPILKESSNHMNTLCKDNSEEEEEHATKKKFVARIDKQVPTVSSDSTINTRTHSRGRRPSKSTSSSYPERDQTAEDEDRTSQYGNSDFPHQNDDVPKQLDIESRLHTESDHLSVHSIQVLGNPNPLPKDLKLRLAILEAENSKLKLQIELIGDKSRSEVDRLKDELEHVRRSAQSEEQILKSENANLKASLESSKATHEQAIELWRSKCEKLTAKGKSLRSALEQAVEQVKDLKENANTAQGDDLRAIHQAEMVALNEEMSKWIEKNEQLEEDNQNLKSQVQTYKISVEKFKTMQATMEERLSKISSLQTAADEMFEWNRLLEQQVAQKQEEINKLKTTPSSEQGSLKMIESLKSQLKEALDAKENALEMMNHQVMENKQRKMEIENLKKQCQIPKISKEDIGRNSKTNEDEEDLNSDDDDNKSVASSKGGQMLMSDCLGPLETFLKVHQDTESENKWEMTCSTPNKNVQLSFTLEALEDGHVEYVPLDFKVGGSAGDLSAMPDFLRRPIYFGSHAIAPFFSKLVSYVYSQ